MLKKTTKEEPERRVGLFGGTFNPIHLGHLRGAEEIREAFLLQEVIFIPAAIPPHKITGELVEARHRLEMVRRAISTNPAFSVSDIEITRSGKSYSIDTIRHLQGKHQDVFFFILGKDAFVEIETWKEYQNLFSLCNFIVMTRPGLQKTSSDYLIPESLLPAFRYDPRIKNWIHTSGHTLQFREITYLDISSTKVRDLLEGRESVKYLVPAEVENYMQQYGLYRKS